MKLRLRPDRAYGNIAGGVIDLDRLLPLPAVAADLHAEIVAAVQAHFCKTGPVRLVEKARRIRHRLLVHLYLVPRPGIIEQAGIGRNREPVDRIGRRLNTEHGERQVVRNR